MDDFVISKESIVTPFIGEDGNKYYSTDKERFFLKNRNDEMISNQYYCMIPLGNDHFAVCDLVSDVNFFDDYNEYDIIKGDYEATAPKMKWGVIRVNRDYSGNIIPCAEVMVVPYLYDRISANNLKTATVENDGKFSYLDLDVNGSYYGNQLVPCILEHAVPFCVDIDGFAECSINGTVGYLSRESKPIDTLENLKLLTKEEAKSMSNILNNENNSSVVLDISHVSLTGTKNEQGKKLVLGKSSVAKKI